MWLWGAGIPVTNWPATSAVTGTETPASTTSPPERSTSSPASAAWTTLSATPKSSEPAPRLFRPDRPRPAASWHQRAEPGLSDPGRPVAGDVVSRCGVSWISAEPNRVRSASTIAAAPAPLPQRRRGRRHAGTRSSRCRGWCRCWTARSRIGGVLPGSRRLPGGRHGRRPFAPVPLHSVGLRDRCVAGRR